MRQCCPVRTDSFQVMWRELAEIGRDPSSGGYRRHGWSAAEQECEAWFVDQAGNRGLQVDQDGNGNLVAWWGALTTGGIVTGSHLDSVPGGGAFDGPLGVVSALAAIDRMRESGVEPDRPIGVAVFVEEEGSRFGMPCLGSRLMTGALDADRAAELRDPTGRTLPNAMQDAGLEPDLGPSDLLHEPSAFVELHVEQGRGLVHADAAVGVASAIWPHGRWRMEFAGRADHAGTTAMADRHDPMLTFAMTALAANKQARLADALATVGRVEVEPGGTNAIPSHVRAWLDARAPEQETLQRLVAAIGQQATDRAARDGTSFTLEPESVTARVDFTAGLRDQLAGLLGDVPVLATGAGHDAGVLAAAGVPSAMLFVRNPTGVSHSPAEHAEPADCEAGVEALATVLTALAANSG
jgi:beta-ureidopropionase / N-carbamoyl-L-amino-acid hydrolase